MALLSRFRIPEYILNEPYRLLFPVGWAMGLIGASYWLLVTTGISESYQPVFHGFIQIELFAGAFAVGFLLTALPKFLRTRGATEYELWSFIALYVLLAGAIFRGAGMSSQWLFIALLVSLCRFGLVRLREARAAPPFSFLLVGFGILEGAVGSFLTAYPTSVFPLIGSKLLEQGMFLSLSLGVGSFLAPRLMGVVDVTNAVVSIPGRSSELYPWYRRPESVVFLIGLTIFLSFFVETAGYRQAGLLLRVIGASYCLFRFNVLKRPRSESIIGILVAVSMWCLILGIFAACLFPAHETGALHLTYIGGFGLLILSIGGQVVSSHGGVPGFWKTHKIGAAAIAALILSAALIRLSATVFPTRFFLFIGISAVLFDIGMILWGLAVLPHVVPSRKRST